MSAPLNSSVLPRWQRKALTAKAMENQNKTPGKNKTPGAKKTPGVGSCCSRCTVGCATNGTAFDEHFETVHVHAFTVSRCPVRFFR